MAVQRRVNWVSQQRVDVPDMRSVESAASNDFDQLIEAMVTNTSQGYFVRGFNILMAGAIGGAASSLQLEVDPGAVLHINASQSGTILMVPAGTPAQQLNAATNPNVVGAFSPSSVNYVTIDYIRFIDDATSAQVYIWDPTSNDETTITAPRAQILEYQVNVSTATPTPNLLPIAVILTDAGNNVLEVTDARWLLCRLGTGGPTPNPAFVYPWPEGRSENPSSSTSSSIDPFYGGDKGLTCLKDWMNAVMSVLLEIKGTTYWYSISSSGSLESLREDLGNTVVTGSGDISNGIIPNAQPILTTTGNIVSGSNQLTTLASTAGIANGQYIIGTGIVTGTLVENISGSTVTMSENASLTITTDTVSFYDPSVITTPGQINWDAPIQIRVIGSALNYVIATNYNSTDITLSDDEAAYINLVRGVSITPNLIFTNGVQQVVSVGAVSWTSLLEAGDFVKLGSTTDAGYYLIQSVDSLTQVTLAIPFAGTSTGAAGAQSQYAFGNYYASATPAGDPRAIQISSRESVPVGQNIFWLFLRNDNGGNPRVYIRFLGAELDNGDSREISGITSAQLLLYVGSPVAGASKPQYVSALNPNSVPEITLLSFGTEAQTNQSSYFLINASGNARQYYVWFNENGGGTDPAPGGTTNASIMVPLTTGQTAAQVAAAVTLALNTLSSGDFNAVQQLITNEVLVTNTSAGSSYAATPGNMAAPFTITINQAGTGVGNNFIHDGDNLTLAIKELDMAIGNFFALVDEPCYDETIDIVTSGGTYPGSLNPPVSINGPISTFAILPLPNNSRLGDFAQKYTVGRGYLQIFLNGQYLRLGEDWLEVGASGALSTTWQTLRPLVVGDSIELRLQSVGGSGGGGGGPGPEGPPGPQGPPGVNEAGGPIAISTKTSNYSAMISDNFLLADCTSNPVTFTLPLAGSAVGRIFYFKKIDSTSNLMTFQTSGGQFIDGVTSISTSVQYEAFSIVCDGTSYWIF